MKSEPSHVHCLSIWAPVLALLLAVLLQAPQAMAGMKSPPPERIKAVIIGDRVVDIAYHLGVLPEAMSVRGGLWPMAKKLKTVSQILGCPNCVTVKKQDAVPKALTRKGIREVIVERNEHYCLYKPDVDPENVVPLLDGLDVDIRYVDFSNGLESAIRRTADLVGRESKAEGLIEAYAKNLKRTREMLPEEPLNKSVVIIKGTYQPATGKSLLQVEAPGGYADRFLLKPLGCTNEGNAFNPAGEKPVKGHFMVRKSRHGFDLSPLLAADPDVIVATGDVMAVQKALHGFSRHNPDLREVTAIREMNVFGLPGYIDSGVIEYPTVLRKWAVALTD